jgi:hypothetical protein
VTNEGNWGHHENQLVRDFCLLCLPDTPKSLSPGGSRGGALPQEHWPYRGLREGDRREETAPHPDLTPSTIPPISPAKDWQGARHGSASCHSPGLLSGTGVSNKGSFRLASPRRMFTRRSDEKLSPNAVL